LFHPPIPQFFRRKKRKYKKEKHDFFEIKMFEIKVATQGVPL
jgi:hypothetical protein